jgi:hypothetical protein
MQVPSARHLVLACCCSLVVAAPVHAAGWAELGPVSDAPTGGDSQPSIAVDPDGDAIAVWSQDNGSGSDVWAATRPAGGTWAAAQKLTLSQDNRDVFDPAVTLDDDGNAIITWIRDAGTNGPQIIQYAEKPVDGAIGATTTLPSSGGVGAGTASAPTILFDDEGTATAIFDFDPGVNAESRIRAMTKPRGGTWSAPDAITDGSTPSFYSHAGMDADGDITVTWLEGYLGDPEQLLSKTKPADGDWPDDAEDLGAPDSTGIGDHDLVVRPDGTAVAAWTQTDADDEQIAQISVRQGNVWTATDITPGNGWYDQPALDVDGIGAVTFAARRVGPDLPSTIVAARMPATSTTLGDPETISDGANTVFEPAIDTAADGTPTVAWRDGDDELDRDVVNASRLIDGSWTFPAHVAVAPDDRGSFGTPFVAHDQHDNVLVVATEGSDERVSRTGLSVYDQVAPTLDSATGPATATSGQAVTFTAAAHDDWLPVLPHWGFGETFKAGFSVEQAFTAGTHTVHVGAVDLVGNTSAIAERTITVTDPPAPATGGGTTTKAPAPPAAAPPAAPQAPKPPATNPIAALVQQLFGGKPGTVLADVRLGTALVYGTGEVATGKVKAASTVPLFAFVAQRDTKLTVAMTLQSIPSGKAAAAAAVKLKTQKLSLKAGQGAVVKAKLTSAQRKLIKKAKGKARLVVTISETGGKTATKKLRLS